MKKLILICILLLNVILISKAQVDPCASIIDINCGTVITFSVSGAGNPDYPNGMNGQGCSSGTSQGGSEKVYRFIVPPGGTGTYQFNVLSTQGSTNYYADYYWKYGSTSSCSNTGWTCFGRIWDNQPAEAFNWNAGDTILFLINAENPNTTTQTFRINCKVRVCDNVQTIKCDSNVTFSVYGYGNPDYPNGMNGQGCSSGTSQGGSEKVYRFIVPPGGTGTYQFNVLSTQGSTNYYADYYWKYGSTSSCSNTGWTCFGRIWDNQPAEAFNWNAGDTILFLINAENPNTTTQTFRINCKVRVCDNVQTIKCDSNVTFSVYGYGNPDYPNGMNGQGCSSGTSQGGSEKVYRFIVPPGGTGTYQFNVLSTQGSTNYYADYYWKYGSTSSCSNTGWTCFGRIWDNQPAEAFNWNAGDTILFLINAENPNTTTQTFRINCKVRVCDNVQTIKCDSNVTFSVYGYGNPDYPNGMNGQGCSSGTSQGGSEKVYRFIVPPGGTGTYQFNVLSTQGSTNYYADYYWKYGSTSSCSNTGWTCFGRIWDNQPAEAFNWNAGDTILFLINAENPNTTTQTFRINCKVRVCDNVQTIKCDSNVTFSVYGYGNPDYPNGMNGQGCSSGTSQGGSEKVYRFIVPPGGTGTYQFNVLSTQGSTNYYADYYWKYGSTSSCSNTGWTCFGRIWDNQPAEAFNWNAGDTILFLINAENPNTTTQTFRINCKVRVCDNVQTIKCDSNVTFSVYGYGNPDYPNGMNGQGCSSGTSQGGSEKVYRFIVPPGGTGTYQFNVLSTQGSTNYYADYYWKYGSTSSCSNTGWTCFGRIWDNQPAEAFNWNAGDTILFLINAENPNTTTQTFRINCKVRVCDNVQTIKCDSNVTFSVYGYGNPDYPNGMNGQGCSSGTSQGGSEKVYRFIVPPGGTGTYQFNVLSTQNSQSYYADYYWKYGSTDSCSNTGWTCLGRFWSSQSVDAFNWNAGDTILFLINAESTGTTTQTFRINCKVRVCDNVQTIKCDSNVTFSVYGYGNPDYPNGMNGQGCSSGTSQGGSEKVYRFIVPPGGTGTYQFNVLSTQNSQSYYADYYWKYGSTDSCSNTGWTCLGRFWSSQSVDAFNWNAGDTILFLINAESTGTTTQTFQITCGTRVCDEIKDIACGDTSTFSVFGYGNPDYPNNFSTNGCASATSGQGGLEKIYRLPPQTGTYQLSIISATGGYVEYLWKYDSICCNPNGWNCIGVANGISNFAAINAVPGASILIMLNAEATGTVTHKFKVTCTSQNFSTVPSCLYASSSSICKNDSVKLAAQQGYVAQGDTLKWYAGSCGGTVIGTGKSIYVKPTATTNYFVRAKGSTSTTACAQITVTVHGLPAVPTITQNGPTTFCSGTTPLTLTSSGASAYQWLRNGVPIDSATKKNYKPVTTGNHKIQVTNVYGCSRTSTTGVQVTVNGLPGANITASGPLTFCNGDSVVFTANSGTALSYQWTLDGSVITGATNQTYIAKVAGKYKVIVTNSNLCSKTSKVKNVVINCRLNEIATTSVDNDNEMEIELAPNPTSDILTLNIEAETDGKTSICIYNIAGVKMLCKDVEVIDGNYQNQFDVSLYPQGMYMLIIEKGESRVTRRFVKN